MSRMPFKTVRENELGCRYTNFGSFWRGFSFSLMVGRNGLVQRCERFTGYRAHPVTVLLREFCAGG